MDCFEELIFWCDECGWTMTFGWMPNIEPFRLQGLVLRMRHANFPSEWLRVNSYQVSRMIEIIWKSAERLEKARFGLLDVPLPRIIAAD
jgi:hypothetical protein